MKAIKGRKFRILHMENMTRKVKIIPVAGGKGGTGKSIITANLGIALSQSDYRVIVVDLDLGGSNLYSYLGLPNKFPGLGDFLKAKALTVDQLPVPTRFPNLSFIPGDGQTPFMANINYGQKKKLLRMLHQLDADYILLDLGAGSGFNTLDFFGLDHRGLIITTTEYPAIMNLMVFLKNFTFRVIEQHTKAGSLLRREVERVYRQPMEEESLTVEALLGLIDQLDAETGAVIRTALAPYRPWMIYNMVEDQSELSVINKIEKNLKQRLSLDVEHLGLLPRQATLPLSVKQHEVYLEKYAMELPAKLFRLIARRIIKIGDARLEQSSELILHDSAKIFG